MSASSPSPESSQPPKDATRPLSLGALLAPETIDTLVRDCAELVRREAASRSGVSGVVIKGGLKVIEKTRPQILEDLFRSLLPTFVARLETRLGALMSAAPKASLSTLITENASTVAGALLAVTDERAERSKLKALVKVYSKLRPLAEGQIITAVPALAELITRYTQRDDA